MKMWEEEKKERTGEKLNLGLKNVLYNYQAGSEGWFVVEEDYDNYYSIIVCDKRELNDRRSMVVEGRVEKCFVFLL